MCRYRLKEMDPLQKKLAHENAHAIDLRANLYLCLFWHSDVCTFRSVAQSSREREQIIDLGPRTDGTTRNDVGRALCFPSPTM